jgi:hypothetical protein
MAAFAPKSFQMDDLTKGLNPFAFGLSSGSSSGKSVQSRAQAYDMMMHGLAAPTLGEQDTFTTKEVSIPTVTEAANIQLRTFSVVLDVLQGPGAPLASEFRRWVTLEWPEIQAILHLTADEGVLFQATIIPRILRWLQTRIGLYLQRLMSGMATTPPELPRFYQVTEWVATREWYLFPLLPPAYRPAPAGGQPAPGAPMAPPRLPAVQPPPAAPARAARGGAVVTNPARTQAWMDAFAASPHSLQDIREHAPKTNDNTDVCLSWHLRGQCVENCQRGTSHRNLQQQEQDRMNLFVTAQLPPP